VLGFGEQAQAIPLLQVYLEGADYDSDTETWVLTPEGSSSGVPFRLWTIGNVNGPGGADGDPILDAKIAIAYSTEDASPNLQITLTPSTTGGFGGFVDPSTPANPFLLQTVTDGSTPVLNGGRSLPPHGVYGPGVTWQEWAIGDFDLTDSPVADFISVFPEAPAATQGQINVYEVSVLNGSGLTMHFDLYNHVEGARKGKFAPFSHTADGDANIIPEPSTLAVWSFLSGLGLLVGARRGRRDSKSKSRRVV